MLLFPTINTIIQKNSDAKNELVDVVVLVTLLLSLFDELYTINYCSRNHSD